MDCSLPGSSDHGDAPGKNIGVGCHALLQGIFPTEGLNPGLPHCIRILYHRNKKGSPLVHSFFFFFWLFQSGPSLFPFIIIFTKLPFLSILYPYHAPSHAKSLKLADIFFSLCLEFFPQDLYKLTASNYLGISSNANSFGKLFLVILLK